jgi:hypothetical protein
MNQNIVKRFGFSSESTAALYESNFATNPLARKLCMDGHECGSCSFYAKFNSDYGLCCHPDSPHLTETVFEHFACKSHVDEGWGAHSFTTNKAGHCKCYYGTTFETNEAERRVNYVKDWKRLLKTKKL